MEVYNHPEYLNIDYRFNNEYFIGLKDYIGFYKISNYGRIISLIRYKHETIVKCSISRYGYLRTKLSKSKICTDFLIHTLVASSFVFPFYIEDTVNHKDLNKLNNYTGNLEYMTFSENVIHSIKNGAKKLNYLNSEQRKEVKRLYFHEQVLQINIAEQFGIAQGTVSNIIHDVYTHLM